MGHRHMAHIFLLRIFFPLTQAAAAFWRAMFAYDCFRTLKWSSSDWQAWYNLFGIGFCCRDYPCDSKIGLELKNHSLTCRYSCFLQAKKEMSQDYYHQSFGIGLVQSCPCSANSFLILIPGKFPEPPTIISAASKGPCTNANLFSETVL